MPNPLMSAFQKNTSKKPPTNPGVTEPLEPVLEDYAGDNNAWRGTELHGVRGEHQAEAYDMADDKDTQEGYTYLPAESEVDPIPVRVVGEFSRERKRFRAYQYAVDSSKVHMIVGRHEKRQCVRIRNIPQVTTNNNSAPASEVITTQTNQVASGTSAEVTIPATGWTSIEFFLNVTSLTGAAPDLTFTIEETIDGTNWATAATFTPNVTAAGYYSVDVTTPISTRVRVRWVLNSGSLTDLDFNVRSMRFPVSPTQTTVGQEVFIGHDLSLTTWNGYRLEPGQEMILSTEDEIYAICTSAESTNLEILDEFSVEL